MSDSNRYKSTIHLPATDFPMRGDLPKREPETLARWQGEDLYARHVIPNYGHIDCIFGKNAAADVYPHVLRHLEATL